MIRNGQNPLRNGRFAQQRLGRRLDRLQCGGGGNRQQGRLGDNIRNDRQMNRISFIGIHLRQ